MTSGTIPKVLISESIDSIFRRKQEYFQGTRLDFIQRKGRRRRELSSLLLVTFQALGKGMMAHSIPSRLLWGSQPNASGSSLVLPDQGENAQWPQPWATPACLAFHQHLNQTLASSWLEANWPNPERPRGYRTCLQWPWTFSPRTESFISSAICRERKQTVWGLQLFLSTGV